MLASLLLLLLVVWLEPPGSSLSEPDETRYAEIPREMLASGDFLTPTLNGVAYFEKPPLLYWANATSLRLFGETPWAARLPTRLAGLGTTLLILFVVWSRWGRTTGLAAGLFFLCAPLGFALSRMNLTDGLLTFFFTATLLAGYETMLRRKEKRPSIAFSILTGLSAAAAVLSKGLIGIVLPGVVLFLWCLATAQLRLLKPLVLSAAVPVFLLVTAPWFVLMELRHSGFLHFFFIREHLQRYATPGAQHDGPLYFFLLVFLAGFLPGVMFFLSGLSARARASSRSTRRTDALFFIIWFAVVLIFFSLSRSKLVSYLFPAFPAAAALAAGNLFREKPLGRAPWLLHAAFVSLLIGGVAVDRTAASWIRDYRLGLFAVSAALCLLAGSWSAVWLAHRKASYALAALAAGWAGLYGSLSFAWPRTPYAAVHELGQTAKVVASEHHATVVSYRTFVRGLPWEMKSVVPVVGSGGEISEQLGAKTPAEPFWSADKLWQTWTSGRPLIVLVREFDLKDFDRADVSPHILGRDGRWFLISNFFPRELPKASALTSAALYHTSEQEPGTVRIPLAEVPAAVLARAQRESRGERLLWAVLEEERGERVYEVFTGGRKPRAIELSLSGDLRYVEEEIPEEDLPHPVRADLSRAMPGIQIAYVMRESRRTVAPSVLYEVYFRNGGLREVEFPGPPGPD